MEEFNQKEYNKTYRKDHYRQFNTEIPFSEKKKLTNS